jgi:hypothetical protein
MKESKKNIKQNLMAQFLKAGGGTETDPESTTKNPEALGRDLQESFDKIFPELIKPSKYRKHVIFDEDVFQFFEGLCGDNGSRFSSMINSALRSFVRERILFNSKESDPVAELLSIRERERELLKEIKELNLTEELKQKLG